MITGKTLVTREAAVRRPAKSHLLTNLQTFGFLAQCGNDTGHFMTGHKRITRKAKVVIKHRKIRVTDTAMGYFDLDFFRTEFTWIIAEQFECAFGGLGSVGVIGRHEFVSGAG
jgi:hypothetical protein